MNTRSALIAYATIASKEMKRILRIWLQTLLPPAITMTLYFLIFGKLIGRQIGDIQSFTYMQFIVPGLIMMSVITNSYSNVVSSFFMTKFQKNIEEMLVSPISSIVLVSGYMTGGVFRGLVIGAIVTTIAMFFTSLPIYNVGVILAVILLTSMLFSMAGFTNAIFAHNFDDISIIPNFVLTPLTYLGGVFYSIDMLPPIWYRISQFNPILYMVNAFRYGFLGITDINIYFSFTMIIAFFLSLFTINIILIHKGYRIKN